MVDRYARVSSDTLLDSVSTMTLAISVSITPSQINLSSTNDSITYLTRTLLQAKELASGPTCACAM